jgi:transcriptional regulator with XRE-family HTH domain
MLAELRAEAEGIGWMFCDTDSMALSRPSGMRPGEFLQRAKRVQAWFDPLNPYCKPQPLFKVEHHNFALDGAGQPTSQLAPLYGFAVSAKRNVLFNRARDGRPILRKVSAHGLGHLRAPYDVDHAPTSIPTPSVPLDELEVERWQYDLWYRIALAALGEHPEHVDLGDLPGFDQPAAIRYAATTPALLSWYQSFNEPRPYTQQVRPFGFLLAFQAKASAERDAGELPQMVAPFDTSLLRAASRAFNRLTGKSALRRELKAYREALAQYHLHPESKFIGGDYTGSGVTMRRHVSGAIVTYIGKEANEWERQLHLGADQTVAIVYGGSPPGLKRRLDELMRRTSRFNTRDLAQRAGLSLGELSLLRRGQRNPRASTLVKLARVADLASSDVVLPQSNRIPNRPPSAVRSVSR